MEESGLAFSPLVTISTEESNVYALKLAGDDLLYSGDSSQVKVAKYDGSTFQLF